MKQRIEYLDLIKGIAIISVVLLHIMPDTLLFKIGAPFHIWHSVPLFMFVAGITGTFAYNKYKDNLIPYYKGLPQKAFHLYLPYFFIAIMYSLYFGEKIFYPEYFTGLLKGYFGAGGYFIPLMCQHLIFFPLVLYIKNKINDDKLFLVVMLIISVLAEYVFTPFDVQETKMLYRLYYGRYLFITSLGAYFTTNSYEDNKKAYHYFAICGFAYIIYTAYLKTNIFIIRLDDWYFQHYPAYFYTVFLVFTIVKYQNMIPFKEYILEFGKNSYSIFIFQMFFFAFFGKYVHGNIAYEILTLPICLYGGMYSKKLINIIKQKIVL